VVNDYVISLIRTWCPIAIGAVVSWLAARGLQLDPSTSAGLIAGLTGLLAGAYYTVVRLAEAKWPVLGLLLGHAAKPQYHPAKARKG
jgi:uncharacterized membrane protein (DUF441 family)